MTRTILRSARADAVRIRGTGRLWRDWWLLAKSDGFGPIPKVRRI
jgi:hypothetical protein